MHLATHGFFYPENGLSSFVAFSDAPLTANYFYQNASVLRANFVVLSAGRTALGQYHPDRLIGLGNALFVGGAIGGGSALWHIDDRVTVQFTGKFYQSILNGDSVSAAL